MIGKTNVGGSNGGGSVSSTNAMLFVKAPTGSTVTMTRSGVTLLPVVYADASDQTISEYVFTIRSSFFSSSAWTVTATLSTQSKSDTVVINSSSVYWLILTYNYYLIRNGVASETFTLFNNKGSMTSESGYLVLGNNRDICMAYTSTPMSLENYTSLNILLTKAGSTKAGWSLEGNNAPSIGIGTSTPTMAIRAGDRWYADAGNLVAATKFRSGSNGKIGEDQLSYSVSLDGVNKTLSFYASVCCAGIYSQTTGDDQPGYLNIVDFWLE